ncbi:amino acid transporter [Thozetella sp. PMI_491]|nr:amino acid transporter [Thozetella sp. PMI_491]
MGFSAPAKRGTANDRDDMRRLGKQQLFKRNYNFVSTLGFALILMGTWEAILSTIAFALSNGGPSGLIYTMIASFIGFTLIVVSMAEMASIAPTAGGQYHWVSEFAPKRYQKLLSYTIGWLSVLGYQTGATIGAFVSGTMIQGLVILNDPTYVPEHWHGTLIAIGITIFVAAFNIVFAEQLPLVQTLILILHVAGFFAILIPLWVLAPKTPSNEVWSSFVDGGPWGSIGLACLIGMLTNAGAFVGGDSVAHISEETRNASRIIPQAMVLTVVINGVMGLVMVITFCYTMGNLEDALMSPTGYPIIHVFWVATGSNGGAIGLTFILIILGVAGNLTVMAGASRQLFAFARDKGVPFSTWIQKVPPGWDVPINAILLTGIISCIIHCINIGSSIAFNIIMSMGTVALVTSYIVSIGSILSRRLRKAPLLPGHFSLGKMGIPVNVVSIAFLAIFWVMAFFPQVPNPAPVDMNWSIVVYGGVLTFASIYYFFRARHRYDGPVAYVKKEV